MFVYVIEKGTAIGTQCGKIHQIYSSEENARKEMTRLKYLKAKNNVITEGVSEFNKTPDVLEGFWYGPEKGNRTADGFLLRRVLLAD